jgi:two-component system, NtrC family, sensor histidine kinase HydH
MPLVSSSFSTTRALVYVGLGLLGGAAYASVNSTMDAIGSTGDGLGVLVTVHGFVDSVIPVLTGALVGLGFHYVHLRSALARAEALRAQGLHERLHRVERDQAVWMVAAATLHEVNNPLHSLGLLLDELASPPPADEATHASLLASARLNADRVRERLLALKPAADGARPHPLKLALEAEIQRVASDMEPLAREQRVELSVRSDEKASVRCDAVFLRIILENLVRNAIDAVCARGTGGHVEVEASRSGTDVTVRISDDGPGIAPDVKDSLFAPLFSHKPQGLGLGLSIARALAQSMGGELTLGQHPAWTTTFFLKLPAEAR